MGKLIFREGSSICTLSQKDPQGKVDQILDD
jgi:hypothetical protein